MDCTISLLIFIGSGAGDDRNRRNLNWICSWNFFPLELFDLCGIDLQLADLGYRQSIAKECRNISSWT